MPQQIEIFGDDQPEKRSWFRAMARGMGGKCPSCGRGALFGGYVRTNDICPECGLKIASHQADDAPPYVTIMIVGHLAIPLVLAAKQLFDPPMWLQFAVWLPVITLAAAACLPAAKGGLIGIQWANRMHGLATSSKAAKMLTKSP